MITVGDHKKCSGCGVCYSKCTNDAIRIEQSKEGFYVPIIDPTRCTKCGACLLVCPIQNCERTELNFHEAFHGHNKDESIRTQSTSGGIFYAIAKQIILDEGIVFGAAYDENLHVYHTGVERLEELPKLMGSKYSQSNLTGIYPKVEAYLKQGRKVLFSGLPCQIEALLNYLGKSYNNLYTVDFICYGIQSPFVFQEYLKSRNIDPHNVSELKMRSKKYGWMNYSMKIVMKNGDVSEISRKQDDYLQSYSKGLFIEEACYSCNSKKFPRRSDLTLGDFWDAKTIYKNLDFFQGESLIICSSDRGRVLLEGLEEITCEPIDIEELHLIHNNYAASATRNPKREYFFEHLGTEPFDQLVKECTKQPVSKKMKDNVIKAMKAMGIYKYYKKVKK